MLKIQNKIELKLPTQQNNATTKFSYNYLLGVAMIYMTFMILSGITVYKLIDIGWFIIPAGLIVIPFTYSISNVTTEVYGYVVARNMMWWFTIASAFFAFFGFLLSHTPSPKDFQYQKAFMLILGNMPVVFIAGIIASVCGISFNNYSVSKLKKYLNGRKYWLRSIITTASGEIMYNFIAYPIMWYGHTTLKIFFHIFICASVFKIAMTSLVWPFECLFASFLKNREGVNVMDYNVNYNPFIFKIDSSNKKTNLRVIK